MGARVESDRRQAAARARRRRAARDQLRAPGRERPGQIVRPARGLVRGGPTTVVEPLPTRDHTELMLEAAGVAVTRTQRRISVRPAERLAARRGRRPWRLLRRPRRSSSPRRLLPGSELTIHDLGLNPPRTGLLDVLERMGARITVFNRRTRGGEPVGDLEVALRRVDRDRQSTAEEVPLHGRRAAAVRTRGGDARAARARSKAHRSCASRKRTASRPSTTSLRGLASASPRATMASG